MYEGTAHPSFSRATGDAAAKPRSAIVGRRASMLSRSDLKKLWKKTEERVEEVV
jgi:hypothetical protein